MFSTRFIGLAVLAAALVLPAAASAQTAPAAPVTGAAVHHGHHGRHHGIMGMMRKLNLSAAQTQQIKSIAAQSRAQNKGVTDPAARKANRERMHQQIEAILTPAQRAQLHQEMQQQRARRDSAAPAAH